MRPAARWHSASPQARHRRRWRFSTLLVAFVVLPGCAGAAAADGAGDLFETYEIVTGTTPNQTVLTGFFLADRVADVAVVHVDASGARRLRIYGFTGDGWEPRLEATLRPGVLFVDVARIGGRDRLIAYEPGRLSWFDPESAMERPLAEVTIGYDATPAGLAYGGLEPTRPFQDADLPHVDISRDLNHDGRDDLILPDLGGFRVLVQTADGTFADPVELGPAEPFGDRFAFAEKRRYAEVGLSPLTIPLYLSRVHELDYDRDGRSDLVFWHGDRFEVHYQDERGLFGADSESFNVDVPFASDGVYSLIFGHADESAIRLLLGARKSTRKTVLHSFSDVSGDGVADLVTYSMEGRSLLKQRSLYEVHFGTPTPQGISFARAVSAAVRPQAKAPPGYSSARLLDMDGDGRADLGVGTVRTGVGAMLRALLNTSITTTFEIYRLEQGAYPDEPTARRRVKSDIDVRGGRDGGFWPAVLMGDVNGDGRSDLLVGKSRRELQVFLGGPDLLAPRPRTVAVDLPGSERNSWLADLNHDGKQDLLLHHPSTGGPHRVTALIAR